MPFTIFVQIVQFLKESLLTLLHTGTSFVLDDVGNQLNVRPNVMAADDAHAAAHYERKTVAILNR